MAKNKQCTKCKKQKPFSAFNKSKLEKDGLQYHCKNCLKKYRKVHKIEIAKRDKKYRKARRIERNKYATEYRKTIKGHLRKCFYQAKDRCNNPKCSCYENYGKRGIKCLFKSSQEFVNYVINELKVDPRGLVIDRIDNNGHYEVGNIRFITIAESNRNRKR